jgi:hypothetical protein
MWSSNKGQQQKAVDGSSTHRAVSSLWAHVRLLRLNRPLLSALFTTYIIHTILQPCYFLACQTWFHCSVRNASSVPWPKFSVIRIRHKSIIFITKQPSQDHTHSPQHSLELGPTTSTIMTATYLIFLYPIHLEADPNISRLDDIRVSYVQVSSVTIFEHNAFRPKSLYYSLHVRCRRFS